jgi:ribose transport system permease protein
MKNCCSIALVEVKEMAQENLNDKSNGMRLVKKITSASEFGVITGLILLIIFFSVSADYFLSWSNMVNIARQVSMIAIMAFGATVVIISGGIDLSVGAIMGFSGVFTAALMMNYGMPVWICVTGGILAGGVLGFFNGTVITMLKIPSFIATLAMLNIARGLMYLYTDAKPIYGLSDGFNKIGTGYLGPIPIPVILMLLVFAIFTVLMRKTKVGRYAFSIGGNAEVARLSGINIKRYMKSFYVISGLMAGFAGVILTARMGSGEPNAGLGLELDVIAAVVLGGTSLSGGKGTMLGTLCGTLVMGVLDNGLAMMQVPPFAQMVCTGGIILIAVAISMRKTMTIVK